MAKLYTFGDSFTAGDGCRPGNEYYENYKKSNELIWPALVANHYNIELVNKGHSGCSNEIIIDNLISEWDNINPEDIVIIGKTFSHRFDIEHQLIKNKLISIWGPGWFNWEPVQDWNGLDILKNYLLLFRTDTSVFYNRHCNYLDFLKNQLQNTKGVNTILWDVEKNTYNFETIAAATKRKIIDHHFSFQGHYDFSKWVINKIEPNKKRKTNWI